MSCFLLFPLTFTFSRPESGGLAGFLFDSLGKFDKPFNQAPSLHIALLVILWDCYSRHTPARLRPVLHGWFALIGVSVLTTYQHHVLDIPTGALLGFVCLWLWPEDASSPLAAARLTRDPRRRRLAVLYAAGAILCALPAIGWGNVALWLLWPAVSLALVAGNYALFGAAGFQKAADGHISPAALWLFAPYRLGARLNVRLWTRADPPTVALTTGFLTNTPRANPPLAGAVSLGRFPSHATARGFATVIDLCAELPRPGAHPRYRAFPLLDLIPPAPDQLRPIVAAIEQGRAAGPVLVCCALGYGRSAAACAAWLLATGQAQDAGDAFAMIQGVRPRAVLHDGTRDAIQAAAE